MELSRDDYQTPTPVRIAWPNGTLSRYLLAQLYGSVGANWMRPDSKGQIATGFPGNPKVEIFERDRRMIPNLVSLGTFDAGITGLDILIDSGISLWIRGHLPYPVSYWALASIDGWRPLAGETVGCELHRNFAQKVLAEIPNLPPLRVTPIEGNEECAIGDGLCKAILVVTETGRSIRESGLKIRPECGRLFKSQPVLIAKQKLSDSAEKAVCALATLLCKAS